MFAAGDEFLPLEANNDEDIMDGNLSSPQMDSFFGSSATKFTVLAIFAIAALALCISGPASSLLATPSAERAGEQNAPEQPPAAVLSSLCSHYNSFQEDHGAVVESAQKNNRNNGNTGTKRPHLHALTAVHRGEVVQLPRPSFIPSPPLAEGDDALTTPLLHRNDDDVDMFIGDLEAPLVVRDDTERCRNVCKRLDCEHSKVRVVGETALEVTSLPSFFSRNGNCFELSEREEEFIRNNVPNSQNMTYLLANQYTFLDPQPLSFENSTMIGILLPDSQNTFVEIVARVADGRRYQVDGSSVSVVV
jgi:hypothetical protein